MLGDHGEVVKQCCLPLNLIGRHRIALSLPVLRLSPHVWYNRLALCTNLEALFFLNHELTWLKRVDLYDAVWFQLARSHQRLRTLLL